MARIALRINSHRNAATFGPEGMLRTEYGAQCGFNAVLGTGPTPLNVVRCAHVPVHVPKAAFFECF